MGEMFRYAWRGSSAHWAKSWLNAVGAIVGAAIVDVTGVRFELSDGFLARALFWAIGALLGVAALFLARLCWWPVYRSFSPRGGIGPVLKERFGSNMWPVILMIAGIVLFVVLFGVGAVWYVWPKRDVGQASRPFTFGDAQKLQAASLSAQLSHLSEAKVEFAKAVEFFNAISMQLLAAYAATGPARSHHWRGNPRRNFDNAKQTVTQLAHRDLEELVDLDQHPNYDRNHNLSAPGDDRIEDASQKALYREFHDQHQTNMMKVANLQSLYDRRISELIVELKNAVTSA